MNIWQKSVRAGGFGESSAWTVSQPVYLRTATTTLTGVSAATFSPDGMKMYAAQDDPASSFDRLHQYALSTPWNSATANLEENISLGTLGIPGAVTFNGDGTYMFLLNLYYQRITRYTLSTAWDISTISGSISKDLDIDLVDAFNMYITPDGTGIYIEDDFRYLAEYTMSTPWNVTTATLTRYTSLFSGLLGIFFKPDGTKMFLGRSNSIREYSLGTPWDTTTKLLIRETDIGNGTRSIFIRPDGQKMYTCTGLYYSGTGEIVEYKL